MIESEEVAQTIAERLTASFDNLGEALILARQNETDPAILNQFNAHVRDAFYLISFKLLNLIYKQHPQLRPPEWDAPVTPTPDLGARDK